MRAIFNSIAAKNFLANPNPARIHSPDPFLRAGKFSRGFAKSFSPENIFGKTESALKPHALPKYLEGRTPKEKHPFLFQKKSGARKTEMQGVFFLSGLLAYSPVRGADSFVQFPLEKGSRKVYDYSTSSNFLRTKRMERFLQSKKRTGFFAKTLSAYGGSREIP